MQFIILYNAYHKSHCKVYLHGGKYLSPSQVARTRWKLCGKRGCLCSGKLGINGTQDVNIQLLENGGAIVLEGLKYKTNNIWGQWLKKPQNVKISK